jgi:hypothetical protein
MGGARYRSAKKGKSYSTGAKVPRAHPIFTADATPCERLHKSKKYQGTCKCRNNGEVHAWQADTNAHDGRSNEES